MLASVVEKKYRHNAEDRVVKFTSMSTQGECFKNEIYRNKKCTSINRNQNGACEYACKLKYKMV